MVELQATVVCVVIHCGTNNLANSKPSDIATGVLAIGARAKLGRRKLKIIICEVLHCDLKKVPMRSNVAEVNTILKRKCAKLGYYFVEPDDDCPNIAHVPGTYNSELRNSFHCSKTHTISRKHSLSFKGSDEKRVEKNLFFSIFSIIRHVTFPVGQLVHQKACNNSIWSVIKIS